MTDSVTQGISEDIDQSERTNFKESWEYLKIIKGFDKLVKSGFFLATS